MTITTPRLTLVPLDTGRLESTCRYALDPENALMMVFFPKHSEQEVMEYLKETEAEMKKPRPEHYGFGVLYNGDHIGGAGLYIEDGGKTGELEWIIRRDLWGNGFAAEAAGALIGYFHSALGIERFIAQCDSENSASRQVMKKLGMTYVETHGGRKNRLSDEERLEELYEIIITG